MVDRGLIVACWMVFVAYWLLSAFSTKKTAESRGWVWNIVHRVPVGLGYVLILGSTREAPWNPLVLRPVGALAVGFCVAGLMGAIWSRRTLAGNWSSDPVIKEQQELVERGPYRFVRHPIYTSILLMALGSALAVGRAASFVGWLLAAVGFWLKLMQEEQLMLRIFPQDYAAYRGRVKALMPFVL